MATAVKRKLSASPAGDGIKVVATATPGTLIHTAIAGTTPGSYDEIWLYAYNGHTDSVLLTLEYGGATVPDQNLILTVPAKSGLIPIVPGLLLQNGLTVKAFAAVGNVITLIGFVNQITD